MWHREQLVLISTHPVKEGSLQSVTTAHHGFLPWIHTTSIHTAVEWLCEDCDWLLAESVMQVCMSQLNPTGNQPSGIERPKQLRASTLCDTAWLLWSKLQNYDRLNTVDHKVKQHRGRIICLNLEHTISQKAFSAHYDTLWYSSHFKIPSTGQLAPERWQCYLFVDKIFRV